MINHDLRLTDLKPRTKYETPVQHLNDLKWTSNGPEKPQMDLKWTSGKFEDLQHLILHVFEVQGFSSNLQGIIYLLHLCVTCGNDQKSVEKV